METALRDTLVFRADEGLVAKGVLPGFEMGTKVMRK